MLDFSAINNVILNSIGCYTRALSIRMAGHCSKKLGRDEGVLRLDSSTRTREDPPSFKSHG